PEGLIDLGSTSRMDQHQIEVGVSGHRTLRWLGGHSTRYTASKFFLFLAPDNCQCKSRKNAHDSLPGSSRTPYRPGVSSHRVGAADCHRPTSHGETRRQAHPAKTSPAHKKL